LPRGARTQRSHRATAVDRRRFRYHPSIRLSRAIDQREESVSQPSYTVQPIGFVRSTLVDTETAPRQGDEGAPSAWIEINERVAPGLLGMKIGEELIVLTWLHLAERDVLQVHPRGAKPLTGVFATRSPDRPNPIGLHRVSVLEIADKKIKVAPLEAVDGTPVIDIKCVLKRLEER
jgi:tRNA-Thr(GGU) m(6)t(6)A37 methyltransferase TsaA